MTAPADWPAWALEWYEERLAIMEADEVPDAQRLAKIRTEAEMLRRAQEARRETLKATQRGATK